MYVQNPQVIKSLRPKDRGDICAPPSLYHKVRQRQPVDREIPFDADRAKRVSWLYVLDVFIVDLRT